MDRTGRTLGTLNPVIYFENASGHILLPPEEMGKGPVEAKRLYEVRYRDQGYEWREAGTLADIDRLQKRMVEQEMRVVTGQSDKMMAIRDAQRKETASNLRQRMTSSGCSAYEREFIQLWLDMDEAKRKKYQAVWDQRQMYLWAREQDGKTRVEDRMGA